MDKFTYLYDRKPGHLRPGAVNPEHFRMLIESSRIHSPKVIQAMEDFLVHGSPARWHVRITVFQLVTFPLLSSDFRC
ncbi:MAG: Adhesin biosynthesis transcription regulatory protein [Proteobacteria bacterium]|nr:Adhesin biosynthesis transcription regulatory protein [Pseudomonadota bacterium]